ncbi:MAG TPA: AEC family transporter [Candidatus Eremiobacteraceae bacterium]
MLEDIGAALLPAIITIMLGYLAARHHDFQQADASILNRMVMTYALPIALFLATVSTTRSEFFNDGVLLTALFVAIVGLYCAVFLICRFGFRLSRGMSALFALGASVPNSTFVGTVVLGSLYGTTSGIVVAVSAILQQLTVVPLTMIFLSIDAGPTTAHSGSRRIDILRNVVEAIKQPVVWLPLLGFAAVLFGVAVPKLIADSLQMLGNAASGVALFSAGIILAGFAVTISGQVLFLVFIKNVLQPALVWGGLLALGYTNPLLGEAAVTAALPMVVLIVMLSVHYRVGQKEAASALFISIIASLVTTSFFIFLTSR